MKSIVGLMNRGRVAHTRGEITLGRERIDRLGAERIVDLGVAMVPEGRRLFSRMSVRDNLLAGAYLPRCRPTAQARLEEMYSLFPASRSGATRSSPRCRAESSRWWRSGEP
jgi:branched-chain amino acid transport system ATP-binding protein